MVGRADPSGSPRPTSRTLRTLLPNSRNHVKIICRASTFACARVVARINAVSIESCGVPSPRTTSWKVTVGGAVYCVRHEFHGRKTRIVFMPSASAYANSRSRAYGRPAAFSADSPLSCGGSRRRPPCRWSRTMRGPVWRQSGWRRDGSLCREARPSELDCIRDATQQTHRDHELHYESVSCRLRLLPSGWMCRLSGVWRCTAVSARDSPC